MGFRYPLLAKMNLEEPSDVGLSVCCSDQLGARGMSWGGRDNLNTKVLKWLTSLVSWLSRRLSYADTV